MEVNAFEICIILKGKNPSDSCATKLYEILHESFIEDYKVEIIPRAGRSYAWIVELEQR